MRVLLLASLCCCSEVNQEFGLKDDNFLEEMVEEAIFIEFHQKIDLTPNK